MLRPRVSPSAARLALPALRTSAARERARRAALAGAAGLWRSGWVAVALITLGAAALRLAHLGAVVSDPFYDGAVRSMTLSWHNFFFGAVEPGGSGRDRQAAGRPVAAGRQRRTASAGARPRSSCRRRSPGTLAVPLLFAARRARLRRARRASPRRSRWRCCRSRCITARSDTMDAVMMALMVLALLLAVRARRDRRARSGCSAPRWRSAWRSTSSCSSRCRRCRRSRCSPGSACPAAAAGAPRSSRWPAWCTSRSRSRG